MAIAATLLQTWTSTETLIGGLGNGYWMLQNGSQAKLYSVSSPSTALDTVSASLFRFQTNQNQAGQCYYIWHNTGSGTIETVRAYVQFGAIGLDAVGGFSGSLSGNSRRPFVSPDASQLVWHEKGVNIARIISTSTGANTASYDFDTVGHSCEVVAALGSDLALVDCVTHDKFELFDIGAGSLLSDLARPTDWTRTNPYPYAVAGTDLVSVVAPKSGTSPTEYYVGTLTTAGSVVAWDTGPDLITPGWGVTGSFAVVANWGRTSVAAPSTTGDASSANYTVMTVDSANARALSANESVLYPGIATGQIAWVDSTHFVAGLTYPNSSGSQQTWSLWETVEPPVYRRPFGTSYHLRQRQTPYIT